MTKKEPPLGRLTQENTRHKRRLLRRNLRCGTLPDIEYACGAASWLCTKSALFWCEAVLPKQVRDKIGCKNTRILTYAGIFSGDFSRTGTGKTVCFLCQSAFGRFFFVSEKIREKREELMCAAVGGTIRKERPDHRPLFIFVGNAIAGFHANFNNPPSSDTVPPAGRWGRPACGRGCPEWPAPAPAPRSHGLPPAAYPPECAPCSAKSRCHGR